MKEPKYVAATLEWCNAQRVIRGLQPLDKLPKGKISDPVSCPCGKATGLRVGMFTFTDPAQPGNRADGGLWKYDLPNSVTRFVCAFDTGQLPQYIDNGTE